MAGNAHSAQAVDLQLLRYSLRRYRRLIAAAVVGGASVGLALALLTPPPFSSESLVVIPEQETLDPETYAEIARSNAVTDQVLASDVTSLSAADLQAAISTSIPTDSLLKIEVSQPDPTDAATLSRAVAEAFVAYVQDIASASTVQANAAIKGQLRELRSQSGQVDKEIALLRGQDATNGSRQISDREAQLLAALTVERADLAVRVSYLKERLDAGSTPGQGSSVSTSIIASGNDPARPSLALHWSRGAFVGGLLGLLASVVLAVRRTRLDARVWSVHVLSRTIGSPVSASLRSRAQRTPEGWRHLLNAYEPPAADVWSAQLLLRSLDIHTDAHVTQEGTQHRRPSVPRVLVTSLAGDRRGQSLGLVIGASAVSLGIRTTITAAGDSEKAIDVWAGLALLWADGDLRDNLSISTTPADRDQSDLEIILVSVDPRDPQFVDVPVSDGHVLALAGGAANVDDLSRVCLAAHSAGHPVDTAVVADLQEWNEQVLPGTDAPPVQAPESRHEVHYSVATMDDPRPVGGQP